MTIYSNPLQCFFVKQKKAAGEGKNSLLMNGERVISPENYQAELIKKVHAPHHLGIDNTILEISVLVAWYEQAG